MNRAQQGVYLVETLEIGSQLVETLKSASQDISSVLAFKYPASKELDKRPDRVFRIFEMMFRLKEIHFRWIGIPIVSLAAIFFSKEHYGNVPFHVKFLESFAFTAVYWNGAYQIFCYYRRHLPSIDKTIRRLSLTIISLSVWMIIGGLPLRILFGYASWSDVLLLETYLSHIEFNFIAAGAVGIVYETVYFFEKWKESVQLAEELKNQQIRTQFEVLQNQMSPHFLFNSLNTLTTLIAENQETAIQFTEKLSDVYRYILQNKDKELVTLEEEMAFAQSYVFLLQMRYPENLNVAFDIDLKKKHAHIAPLTLQILIENAVKHNEISKVNPLNIKVYVAPDASIVVENEIKPKKSLEKSTRTGLANIKKRYSYLSEREITVSTFDQVFKVGVPLLNLVNDPHAMPSSA